ncbi:DUF805 domain-containing protein [Ancylobacter sp. 6x-1]|uniref:DUF805 domain-containing protein n=1 Tax=Ancylobacter crimeensis TaxID=2579147 RepID=A0ABT0D9S5_9HYPH|nr:DUF805 domain-containing protein [Ancylobacter crimeensis]MCK0196708.1 DUF805 domain-containing protein [Ancylobacter crimeensis]
MGFTQAISSVLGQYVSITGRAPRSEYWWWVLFTVLLNAVASIVDTALFGPYTLLAYGDAHIFTPIQSLLGLFLLMPSITVAIRRFHDLDRTGWWLLLTFTGIGAIIVTVWFMFRGTEGTNSYGRDPL